MQNIDEPGNRVYVGALDNKPLSFFIKSSIVTIR